MVSLEFQITVRMNTTHISDVVLVDAITLNYIGEVEDNCYNDGKRKKRGNRPVILL